MYVMGAMRYRLIGAGVSLIIFLVLYFTVISPNNDAANQAIKASNQQAQQLLNQAAQNGSAASSAVNQAVSNAQKLTACIAAAGTDATKLASCNTQFGG